MPFVLWLLSWSHKLEKKEEKKKGWEKERTEDKRGNLGVGGIERPDDQT